MERTNHTWTHQLRSAGPEQEAVLSDLRRILLRGLTRAFGRRISEDVLEDVSQEAIIMILNRLDQFEGRSRFTTWAMSIAMRIAVTKLRRRHWKDISLEDMLSEAEFVPQQGVEPGANQERQAEQKKVLETMRQLIQTELTDKQRQALLAELKGMAQEEIARHTESNRNAVYKLTHDARKRLKLGLEKAGYSAGDIGTLFN